MYRKGSLFLSISPPSPFSREEIDEKYHPLTHPTFVWEEVPINSSWNLTGRKTIGLPSFAEILMSRIKQIKRRTIFFHFEEEKTT